MSMIFQTQMFDLTQFIKISDLDTTLSCKDKGIKKSEFMAKTQCLYGIVLIILLFLKSIINLNIN